ncbi:TonB-dependent receptor [Pseudomonas putida]|jgi:hypothetical protein|nr:hypothetical protein AC138_04705 [Pseudomonas putida]KMY30928.1 hypothetical protein AA993_18790 [Pseudomonas putida]SKC03751.1 hypothetical protein SAMN05216307_2441 [Pseudomonas putida]VEE40844.1 TonB-dependent receptor [Pseudomonas putida]VTQ38520.1 TonB-dependent receptor [Pseudomonas putida]
MRTRPANYLPNSSFKGDGVRVFLSGRDHPYRQDFHASTKLSAPGVTEIIILCDQSKIIGEILAILAEQILSSPLLLEVSQCLEEAILTQVQFIALPIMGSTIAPVCL